MLLALGDGRALPASVLADEAGVAASTASAHLSRLVKGGMLKVERHGRHRYFRLAGPEVGELMESLLEQELLTGGDGVFDPDAAEADRLAAPGYDLDYRLTAAGLRELKA